MWARLIPDISSANVMRSNGFNHYVVRIFLKATDTEFVDVPYYIAV